MNYKQAVEYLNIFNKNKIKMGLERMQSLMARLDNPQEKLQFVHVSGTNGKGSIVNYLANILMADGKRVGTFTSPHLIKINESIAINAECIEDIAFAEAVEILEKTIAGSELEEQITSFEVLTAIAINYFYLTKCDIVILEVGMGGALDATNIISNTLVAIFAKISIDHTDYLGKTLKEIALVKSGIIKPKSTVIIAPNQQAEVLNIIEEKCKELHVNRQLVNGDYYNYHYYEDYQSFHIEGIGELKTVMLGKHQIANAMTAVFAARQLGTSNQSIVKGLANTKWQCRLELVCKTPHVFIDGGHNLDGVAAVVDFFKENYPNNKIKLMFGVLKDKQYTDMIKLLSEITTSVTIVQVNSVRAADVSVLGAIFDRLNIENKQYLDLREAVSDMLEGVSDSDIILITGSLYYMGKARDIIKKELKEYDLC